MIRWRRGPAPPPAIWEGVYQRFADIRGAGEGHASQFWLDAITQEVEYARSGEWHEELVLDHEALLLMLRLARPAHVLDFGGGGGSTYAYVRRAASELALRWTVVELPEVAAHGRTLFAGDDAITFAERPVPAELVLVKTALQYIDKWPKVLHELFALGAQYVILEKFAGVAAPTYAAAQKNLAGSVVPYWFINFDELFDVAAKAGYRRVLWRRLPRVYDQSNFPAELRMGQASTIVFVSSSRV